MSPLISGLTTLASVLFNRASAGPSRGDGRGGSGADSTSVGPAAVVTLSTDAAALAHMAGLGTATAARTPGALRTAGLADAAAPTGGMRSRGAVSQEDFRDLLTEFGATDEEKAALTAGFDANKDGTISREEFLQGLSTTQGSHPQTDFSQAVMRLMDRHGDTNGEVSAQEFTQFTTAFAGASQLRRTAV